MNSLLFKALCTRLMLQQWKALLFASLSVALGLALALAIRLGTESASLNLKKNLETLQQASWVGPVRTHNAAAVAALDPIFARYPYRTSRVVDAYWVEKAVAENSTPATLPLTLALIWSGSENSGVLAKGLLAEGNKGRKEASAPVVYMSELCAQQRGSKGTLRAFSKQFEVQIEALPKDSEGTAAEVDSGSCSVAFASGPAWRAWPQFNAKASAVVGDPVAVVGDPLTPNSISFYVKIPLGQKVLEEQLMLLSANVPGLQFEPQSKQLQSLNQLTQSFNINLQLMGFIAIFIGVFMVHHVFSLIVAKNAQVIAIVHAQGISLRKQMFPLFCVAACLGTVASVLGIIMGVGLGRVLSLVTQSTVRALYARMLDASAFYWNPRELVFAFVLGLGASLVGAAKPLLKIRQLDSAQVLKTGVWESSAKDFSWRNTLLILLTSGAAIAVMVLYPVLVGRLPVGAFVTCLLILFLNALFARDVCLFLYKIAGRQSLSHSFFMQLRVFMPPQVGVVLQVLTLGFALTISVKSMAESFRQTLTAWVDQTLKADVWVRSNDGSATPLPIEVLAAVDAFRIQKGGPQIVAIDALRILPATFFVGTASFPIVFNGVRMREHAFIEPLKFLDSKLSQRNISEAIYKSAATCEGTAVSPCLALISEALSIHSRGASAPGNVISVEAAGRRVFFRIAAVVQDFGSDSGIVMSDISLVQKLFDENPNPSFMNLYLADKSLQNSAAVLQKIEQDLVTNKGYALNLFTLAQLRARVMEAFENTFRITDALYVLCAVIAFISVYTCLNLQLLLRRREWNMMWAMGLGEMRLRKGMALWAGNMALVACAASFAGGLSIAAILVYVVNYYAFGYSLELSLPWTFLAGILALAWISGVASGWVVARGLEKHLSTQMLQLE